jgi:predicted nuclease of predicted toxin-antitoxin system
MRFLLNMNLPRDLCHHLREIGHECRHVADVGLAAASDIEITEVARRSDEIVLTHDLDYGEILTFSGASKPSVIILRLRDMSIDHIVQQFRAALNLVSAALDQGSIVTLGEHSIRIRKLPVGSD